VNYSLGARTVAEASKCRVMSNESDASTGPPALTVIRRRRRHAVFATVAAIVLLWPLALQELAPLRLDTLRLAGASGPGGGVHGGHGGKHRTRAAPPFVTAQAAIPSLQGFGLLGALPPTVLGDLQNLPPTDPAVSADLPAFSTPASAVSSFNPTSFPQGSGPGGPFVTSPGGPTSPSPPIISQPPTDPPVTPPDNPVTTPDPSGPPPLLPPGNPPPVTPQVGPGPVDPLLPDPGGPGGDGPAGDPPVSAVPEPGVWMELLLGAGLAGAALRHARRVRDQPATALRARSSA
jgi:hypothetical protein